MDNVGIVYNFHHGHDHIDRFPKLLIKMAPYLRTICLNGMEKERRPPRQEDLAAGAG